MGPLCHRKKYGRMLLFVITLISLIKCLIFPNTLDILLLVGLICLVVIILFEDVKHL
jgi:hypothetical protein